MEDRHNILPYQHACLDDTGPPDDIGQEGKHSNAKFGRLMSYFEPEPLDERDLKMPLILKCLGMSMVIITSLLIIWLST